jgi:KTSC domain
MDRKSVSSSNIASIGYDSSSQTLEVEFHGGSVYQYSGVPQEVYDGLMGASSHGKYLNEYIKGTYSYSKV